MDIDTVLLARPVIRPAQERQQTPSFTFPARPPPEIKDIVDAPNATQAAAAARDSIWSGTLPSTVQTRQMRRSTLGGRQQRAHSFSTVEDYNAAKERESGAFKVRIGNGRPRSLHRPRTVDAASPYTLQVSIPHYRLGTPRFSAKGTAILRSSAYTNASSTEDLRSSAFITSELDRMFPVPPGVEAQDFIASWNSDARPALDSRGRPSSPTVQRSMAPIQPGMYDMLTFPPGGIDPRVVRYSATTGHVMAATPPRIIAHLTSPDFLDYELLSDFFLTYRAYMTSDDLVGYVITRLQWAIYYGGDIGSIVRVRTFVAIRHWILNYFMDDFVPSIELRRLFCDMLNALTENVKHRPDRAENDLKIIGEVKKCWRRTSALYWDSPHFDGDGRPDETLCPGGYPGTREDGCDPATMHLRESYNESVQSQLAPLIQYSGTESYEGSLMQEVRRAGHGQLTAEEIWRAENEPTSNDMLMHDQRISLSTDITVPAVGYTFSPTDPTSTEPIPNPTTSALHPAGPPHLPGAPDLAGPRSAALGAPDQTQLNHKHQRSDSYSKGRTGGPPHFQSNPPPLHKNEPVMAMPYAGSLVRGTLLPPSQAFVVAIAPRTPSEAIRHPHLRSARSYNPVTGGRQKPEVPSQPGMRRFLENMRRAFSSRLLETSNASHLLEMDPVPKTSYFEGNSNPEADIHPALRKKPPLRVDLLGALVVETFNLAVQDTYNDRRAAGYQSGSSGEEDGDQPGDFLQRNGQPNMPPQVSNGSDSIVIVDDTEPLMPYVMSGGLAAGASMKHMSQSQPQPLPAGSAQLIGRGTTYSPPFERPDGDNADDPGESLATELVPIVAEVELNNVTRTELKESMTNPGRRPPFRRPGHSFRSNRTNSLRRYASYQSGLNRFPSEQNMILAEAQEHGSNGLRNEGQDALGRSLRRRPGGNLREAEHVASLEYVPRPRSAGSITITESGSLRNSAQPGPYSTGNPIGGRGLTHNTQTCSLSAFGDSSSRQGPSLVKTHSSQPGLRPSFEVEVAKLAQIPDDADDDGGIEAALAKLEGKYEKRNSSSSLGQFSDEISSLSTLDEEQQAKDQSGRPSLKEAKDDGKMASSDIIKNDPGSPQQENVALPRGGPGVEKSGHQSGRPRTGAQNLSDSDGSYSSIPILERRLSDDSLSDRLSSPDRLGPSGPLPLFSNVRSDGQHDRESHPSIVYVDETESVREMREKSNPMPKDKITDSFLLDEDEEFSDLSSELSDDELSQTEPTSLKSPTVPNQPEPILHPDLGLSDHPLRHPPSPPDDINQKLSTAAPALSEVQRKPPTPELIPTNQQPSRSLGHNYRNSSASTIKAPENPITKRFRSDSVHLPFILAHDSKTLAQQFTLVEKDALNEVDWKELVELRWKHTPPTVLNWVDYLRSNEPKGLELVVARFNLVVKWTVSEILLTTSTQERANTIIKYIHIAAHTRLLRNYATMYQLTIALLGSDISQLSKTWALVPKADAKTLKDLEALVTPTRNFHNLRVEMESAALEEGCIPFIGVYTHDLIFNAQRPALIPGASGGPQLVNFERYRTTAGIVKDLLRLLEASAKYAFNPVEGVLEKCLWMAALPDDEIRAMRKERE
jgi:hypothetical protein